MAKQFGTTAEVRNYGSVMVSSPAVAIYAAASGRFESPSRRHTLRFLANVGLPGTSGFVGELLVIIGVFQENAVFAGIAALTLILGQPIRCECTNVQSMENLSMTPLQR